MRLAKAFLLMVKRCLPFADSSVQTIASERRKPVVSKSRYLLAVGDKAVSRIIGYAFFVFSLLSGMFCIQAVFLLPGLLVTEEIARSNTVGLPTLLFCLPLTYFLWRASYNAFCRAAAVPPVVPFSRANVSHLPAPETLVRASEEPVQEQEAVLLRSLMEAYQTPSEQLVRAVEDQNSGSVKRL